MTTEATAKIVQYLSEAHATELALVRTLQAHIAMTPRGRYRGILERHLDETRGQARALEGRLSALGEGRSLFEATWEAALTLGQGVVGQALALSKGPLDLLRGASGEEKLLKNAKDECATEALEIATYDALERLAEGLGDSETAELARRHRAQEEQTLSALRETIPALVDAVMKAELRGDPSYKPAETGAAEAVREVASNVGGVVGDAASAAAANGNGASGEPWEGYDAMSANQVRQRLAQSDAGEVERVREYERENKNRATVLKAAERQAGASS